MMSTDECHPIEKLLSIMRALRDPQSGCPWDQQQTFATIAPYTIEEAYEVADAIVRQDYTALRDELGDLLLQVVYHSEMAAEQDRFTFDDVVDSICAKMIRRHPHVFAAETYENSGDLEQEWERIKQQERAAANGDQSSDSLLDNVAVGMPPLVRARKLQKKAARVNFDWPDAASVLNKVEEELAELGSEISAHAEHARLAEEVGDLLFSVVNLCRHMQVDAELALQKANDKFAARFKHVEKLASQRNQQLADLDAKALDELWELAKARIYAQEA